MIEYMFEYDLSYGILDIVEFVELDVDEFKCVLEVLLLVIDILVIVDVLVVVIE